MNNCECQTWCRDGQPPFTEHHKKCPKRDLEGESVKLVSDLIRGLEFWAAEEDGIHPNVWDAYKRAVVFVGDPRKMATLQCDSAPQFTCTAAERRFIDQLRQRCKAYIDAEDAALASYRAAGSSRKAHLKDYQDNLSLIIQTHENEIVCDVMAYFYKYEGLKPKP